MIFNLEIAGESFALLWHRFFPACQRSVRQWYHRCCNIMHTVYSSAAHSGLWREKERLCTTGWSLNKHYSLCLGTLLIINRFIFFYSRQGTWSMVCTSFRNLCFMFWFAFCLPGAEEFLSFTFQIEKYYLNTGLGFFCWRFLSTYCHHFQKPPEFPGNKTVTSP